MHFCSMDTISYSTHPVSINAKDAGAELQSAIQQTTYLGQVGDMHTQNILQ